jgi:hypothetical protein
MPPRKRRSATRNRWAGHYYARSEFTTIGIDNPRLDVPERATRPLDLVARPLWDATAPEAVQPHSVGLSTFGGPNSGYESPPQGSLRRTVCVWSRPVAATLDVERQGRRLGRLYDLIVGPGLRASPSRRGHVEPGQRIESGLSTFHPYHRWFGGQVRGAGRHLVDKSLVRIPSNIYSKSRLKGPTFTVEPARGAISGRYRETGPTTARPPATDPAADRQPRAIAIAGAPVDGQAVPLGASLSASDPRARSTPSPGREMLPIPTLERLRTAVATP